MERPPSPRKNRTEYKEHLIGFVFVGYFFLFFSPPYKTSKYKNLKSSSKAERDTENLNGRLEIGIKKNPSPKNNPKN